MLAFPHRWLSVTYMHKYSWHSTPKPCKQSLLFRKVRINITCTMRVSQLRHIQCRSLDDCCRQECFNKCATVRNLCDDPRRSTNLLCGCQTLTLRPPIDDVFTRWARAIGRMISHLHFVWIMWYLNQNHDLAGRSTHYIYFKFVSFKWWLVRCGALI